ncbi:MORN repeat-containing protein 4-like isoform X2 [Gigantopelta aegis]|uniref:MORN repeat-containing protein 4-like isoform X2 n=1 Tax=Gigantopelta aegis TaxID=1735272 RepID=UPI001B88A31F|nr:MORN repeat-containing protein 4-like isoform X2 [Gigantopelta aegis]
MSTGAYRYPDGSEYSGEWNSTGQRHGHGHMVFPDKSEFWGSFQNGLCNGPGIMKFADGSRYDGEFHEGKFHGFGVFTRCDHMKFEGEFKDGKISGLGLITFSDQTHGLPRNEGHFEGSKMLQRLKCPGIIQRAREAANYARSHC